MSLSAGGPPLLINKTFRRPAGAFQIPSEDACFISIAGVGYPAAVEKQTRCRVSSGFCSAGFQKGGFLTALSLFSQMGTQPPTR